MKTTAQYININSLEISLTITMSLNDWRALKKQLGETHPGWMLSTQISKVISKLEEVAYINEP